MYYHTVKANTLMTLCGVLPAGPAAECDDVQVDAGRGGNAVFR
jgi:hypothetical protein